MLTDFLSSVNTRIMRGFHKILNINYLYLNGVSRFCNKHHFDMQKGPYWGLKSTISHPEMGLIRLRNRHYQKAKRSFSDYVTGYINRRYSPKLPLLYRI